ASLAITANSFGFVEGRLAGIALVAAVALGPRASDGRDDAMPVHLADGVPFALADIGVSPTIDTDTAGTDQGCGRRRSAVSESGTIQRTTMSTDTGKSADDAGLQIDPANTPVTHIGDE